MSTLILSGVVAVLVAERIWTAWHHMRVVDRLTDKILARNYSDYQAGQALKHDRMRDLQEIPPRNDQIEVEIEQKRVEATRKHLKGLEQQIQRSVEVTQ